MAAPDSDEVKQKARSAFVYNLVLWIWKRLVYILAAGNMATAAAIFFAPASAKTSVAFKLMAQINLPNAVVGVAFVAGSILLLFYRTAVAGHLISALALAWWTFLVTYIAIFLGEPTSLISATWAGTLGTLHVLAAAARWNAQRGYHQTERKLAESTRETPDGG